MPVGAVTPTQPVLGTGYLPSAQPASVDGGSGFASTLAGTIEGVQGLQSESNRLAIAAVTGDLNDIHQATLASTRAQVTLELVAGVRNKGVEAFNEIMRMQA